MIGSNGLSEVSEKGLQNEKNLTLDPSTSETEIFAPGRRRIPLFGKAPNTVPWMPEPALIIRGKQSQTEAFSMIDRKAGRLASKISSISD
jgi:hypothetical protein